MPAEQTNRAARPAAETCRTSCACPLAHFRWPAAPRRPTPRPGRNPGRTGTAPAAPAPAGLQFHKWAAGRSALSTIPWSATQPPAWPCGQCGRRSGRTRRSRWAVQRTPAQRLPVTAAWPSRDRISERTVWGKPALPRWHRCRNRRTRSWYRSGSRTARVAANSPASLPPIQPSGCALFFYEGALDHIVAGLTRARRDRKAARIQQCTAILQHSGLPQSMKRSVAGSKGGRPAFAARLRRQSGR